MVKLSQFKNPAHGLRILTVACIAFAPLMPLVAQNQGPDSAASSDAGLMNANRSQVQALTLEEAMRRVLAYNESIQIKLLENEIAQRQYQAERGIFEPAVVGSYEHIESERENTAEQRANLFGQRLFDEENNLYNGGLEFLSPIGSRFRLGYSLRELSNNLNQAAGADYVTTVGLTLTQPLLKGFGTTATLARIRLAAVNSDIAFQDYRRQLMQIVARAEAAYWDLYLTQQQEEITRESVSTAEKLLNDNRARAEAGQASQLEVLESEAGHALRKTRHADAVQKLVEASNQMATLISGPEGPSFNRAYRAAQEPAIPSVNLNYYSSYETAFAQNPDYLNRLKQVSAENIRLAFAKNQRLPQLDLKASYGLNGLGDSIGDSFDDVSGADFPAWSVGVEMRIPVTGGIRERNELEAAKLSQKRSLVSLKEIETQIANALDTSIIKVRSLLETAQSYRSVVDFHQQLLTTQLDRLEVGRVDSRTVLETEEDLFEARINALESIIALQKSLLELQLIEGQTLRARDVDLTKQQLEETTREMIASGKFSSATFQELQRDAAGRYERSQSRAGSSASGVFTGEPSDPFERARHRIRTHDSSAATMQPETEPMSSDPFERARQELRRQRISNP